MSIWFMLGPGIFCSLIGSRWRWRWWVLGVPLDLWIQFSSAVSVLWVCWAVISRITTPFSVPWGVASGAVALSYAAAWVPRCCLGLWPATFFVPGYLEFEVSVAQMAARDNSPETRQFYQLLQGQGIESLFMVMVGRRTLWRTVEVERLLIVPELGHGDALARAMYEAERSTHPEPPSVRITRFDPLLMYHRGAHRGRLQAELQTRRLGSR